MNCDISGPPQKNISPSRDSRGEEGRGGEGHKNHREKQGTREAHGGPCWDSSELLYPWGFSETLK
jgi:hypothetical protein